ncbi:MAG: hypothetical protein A3J42_02415 [Candidatus Dadabacteria bacterium RIFCSPHIGHO2_12_FULL_53_21]|jgi:hypothetical protein|nr:MAG: hypothetical protein A3J42_02415 [Candidatus Dadabacteria bacterium RIFCSPHIGHO2_12_FULL_53_21]
MNIILLQTLIVFLCFSALFLGVMLIKSGNRVLKGEKSNVQKSILDRLFYDYYIWKWLFGESKGGAYRQIWLGVASIIWGVVLFLFLSLSGILF